MKPREIWRLVPSVPSLLASSEGRLMIIPHVSPMPHGGARHYETSPILGVSAELGRKIIRHNGKTLKVHRLIAEAFLGPPPFEKAVVMHINEDASDNRVENLQWGTQKENLNAKGFILYCKGRVGDRNPAIKGRMRKIENAR